MMAEEKELFVPYIAGYLGKSLEDVKQIQAKLDRFAPTAKVNNQFKDMFSHEVVMWLEVIEIYLY